MEMTVYNPQKGRLETIDSEFTQENTTWFDNWHNNEDIYMITDFEGGILIKECNYTYPVWIYDVTRAEIGYDQKKAKEIRAQYVQERMKRQESKKAPAGNTPVALWLPPSHLLNGINEGNGKPGILIVAEGK